MPTAPTPQVHTASEGGIAGTHAPAEEFALRVGPTTTKEFNALRAVVIPFACWKVEELRFALDSSFVSPELRGEMASLRRLMADHTLLDDAGQPTRKPVLSVFGHADSMGADAYNKTLSGRRARSIYALLTRKTAMWEELYSNAEGTGDQWGPASIQTMLGSVGPAPNPGDPSQGSGDSARIKAFQASKGLSQSGQADKATREALFLAYMDFIANDAEFVLTREVENQLPQQQVPLALIARLGGLRDRVFPDETEMNEALGSVLTPEEVSQHGASIVSASRRPTSFRVPPEGFLGAGADSNGKADFQGCGEFNPLVVLSQQQDQALTTEAKVKANAPNRRVVVLLFRPGSRVEPSRWPCPRAKEGGEGCRKRFWSDGEDRRSRRLPDEPRRYEDTQDTFACRFYDRMANTSPCERHVMGAAECFIFLKLFDDSFRRALGQQAYRLVGERTRVAVSGTSDAEGVLRHEGLPDDHYTLECGDKREVVEAFYLAEKERHEGKPWPMRVRGFGASGGAPAEGGDDADPA